MVRRRPAPQGPVEKLIKIPAGKKKTVAKIQFPVSKVEFVVSASARLSEWRIPGKESFLRLQESFFGKDYMYRPAILLTAKKPSGNATFTDSNLTIDVGPTFRVEVESNITAPSTVLVTLSYIDLQSGFDVPGNTVFLRWRNEDCGVHPLPPPPPR